VAEFDILYNEGISPEGELIVMGEKSGVISKSGASYSYGDTKLGRGYDTARNFLKENKKIRNELTKEIRAKLQQD
jgi:recombination protein RecA